MNTSTQKRNGNDRSSTMHNFLDNSIAAERLENFFQDLVEDHNECTISLYLFSFLSLSIGLTQFGRKETDLSPPRLIDL